MQRYRIIGWRWLPVLFPLILLPGCSPAAAKLVPVSGKISVNDQPLANGTVVFHPDADKGNSEKREPRAAITADQPGVYRLATDGKEGAAAGWYKVTVNAMKPVTGMRPPEWLADQRYADEQTSGLSVEVVKDAKTGVYDFKLDPPK